VVDVGGAIDHGDHGDHCLQPAGGLHLAPVEKLGALFHEEKKRALPCKYRAMGKLVHRVNLLLLLLPSSTMGSEDKGQRRELTREGRERRATIPLLCCLVSERHHQQQQRSKANARARRLPQEVDKLDVYNMDRLQVKSEALDLRIDISLHLRMSSSPLLPKTAPPAGPPPVRVLLEE
jgi:hypothetical protein